MILNRNRFFLGLFLLILLPVLGYKLTWMLQANKGTATFAFHGLEINGQFESRHAVMYFPTGNDTVIFHAVDNAAYKRGDQFPVLYQASDPTQASLTTFVDLWMKTLVILTVPIVFLLIVYFHKEIVPYKSNIHLSKKVPFIKIIPAG